MQQRPWQRVLTQAGGAFVLFAVPAVALAWFSPSAWSALAAPTPQMQHAGVQVAAAAQADAALNQWTDTATNPVTLNLVQQARRESAALNMALRAERAQLAKLPAGSFAAQLLMQSLITVAAERDAWDGNWRAIGVPGADQISVQNNLITLQSSFIQANSFLIVVQSQEISSGSIFAYSPPSF